MAVQIAELLVTIGADIATLKAKMGEVGGVLGKAEKSISTAGKKIDRAITTALTVGGIVAFTKAIGNLVEQGEKFGSIAEAFNEVGGSMQAITDAKNATAGMVSQFELMQIAQKGLISQGPAFNQNFAEIASLGAKAADALGIDAKKAIEDLTQSMIRNRKVGFVKELGIAAPTIENFRAKLAGLPPVGGSVADTMAGMKTAISDAWIQMGIAINTNAGFQQTLESLRVTLAAIDWNQVATGVQIVITALIEFGKAFVEVGTFVGENVAKIILFFADMGEKVVASVQAMIEGVQTWMVDKLNAITESVGRAVDSVTGFFKSMYEAVVGGSYVPDTITGIESEFKKLDTVMVKPTQEGAAEVGTSFSDMIDLGSDLATSFQNIGTDVEQTFGIQLPESLTTAIDMFSGFLSLIENVSEAIETISQIIELVSGFMGGGIPGLPGGGEGGGVIPGVDIIPDSIPVIGGILAKGGVVKNPTGMFGAGSMGIMGEAGPEAILPLSRVGGELGVRAVGGGGAGGGGFTIYVDARGGGPGIGNEVRQAILDMKDEIMGFGAEGVYDAMRRRSQFAGAV
jgi:hypothetical protein